MYNLKFASHFFKLKLSYKIKFVHIENDKIQRAFNQGNNFITKLIIE